MAGVKEISELLEGLAILGEVGADIGKDGKLAYDDLAKLGVLIEKHQALLAAVQGMGDLQLEVKDLSMEEVSMLVAKVMEVVGRIKAKLA